LPSVDEAKGMFKADGTLSKSTDPGHLELRTLLEEPAAQHEIGRFAKSIHTHESFMCWVDIQEFKAIPDEAESYRRSKAMHIFQKYIKAGAVLEVGGIESDDRDKYRNVLERSEHDKKLLTSSFFEEIQMICFTEIYQNTFKRFKNTDDYALLKKNFKKKYNSVREDDFEYMEKLGEGGFGLVVHCKKKSTGKHYAMKIQVKAGLLDCYSDDMSRVDFEKQAFASCQHPFIINLDYAFQTETLVMMVLGLATAGDLQQALNNAPQNRLPESRTQFYVAEVVLALAHMHSMGMMYRDLKPNNVLLDADGHIKLADLGGVVDPEGKTLGRATELVHPLLSTKFGPASVNMISRDEDDRPRHRVKRRMSVMGTFGYMAPEMVIMLGQNATERKGYTDAVDWWSLGITTYKLLTGTKPFESKKNVNLDDDDSLFPSPKKDFPEYAMLFQEINFPRYMSPHAQDLIRSFLNVSEVDRLGFGPTGIDDIKQHPFFDGVSWALLEQKHVEPPYLPELQVVNDVPLHDNFLSMMTELGKTKWINKTTTASQQKYFENWDFVSPHTLRVEFGLANEMDQLDRKFKVRQVLGEKE